MLYNTTTNPFQHQLTEKEAFNPSTQEAEVRGYLGIWGQTGLHTEFQASQGYIVQPVSKKVSAVFLWAPTEMQVLSQPFSAASCKGGRGPNLSPKSSTHQQAI